MIIIDNLFTVDSVKLVHAACQIPRQKPFVFNEVDEKRETRENVQKVQTRS